jgi:hypothetical protein
MVLMVVNKLFVYFTVLSVQQFFKLWEESLTAELSLNRKKVESLEKWRDVIVNVFLVRARKSFFEQLCYRARCQKSRRRRVVANLQLTAKRPGHVGKED